MAVSRRPPSDKTRPGQARRCSCDPSGYFNRMREAFNRIQRNMNNQETANLAFLVLQELSYIFCDCDRMVAGFKKGVNDSSSFVDLFEGFENRQISEDANDFIPQPLNSLHLTDRHLKEDLFQKLLISLTAIPFEQSKDDKQSSPSINDCPATSVGRNLPIVYKPQKLNKISERGAYKVVIPRFNSSAAFLLEECRFSLKKEIYAFVMDAGSSRLLYIFWQKKSNVPHTCVLVKFGSICAQQSDNRFPTSLDHLFRKYRRRLKESFDWRPLTRLAPEPSHPQLPVRLVPDHRSHFDEALEHLQSTLAEELGFEEDGIGRRFFFLRALSPQTNHLVLQFTPSSCQFLFSLLQKAQSLDVDRKLRKICLEIGDEELAELLPTINEIEEFASQVEMHLNEELLKKIELFRMAYWTSNDHQRVVVNDDSIFSLYFSVLLKNLAERYPIRRGPILLAGKQGVADIIDPQRFHLLLGTKDPFGILLDIFGAHTECSAVYLYPVLYGERLFGISLIFAGGADSYSTSAKLALDETLSVIINLHQANIPFLIGAAFHDLLNRIRDTLSDAEKGELPNAFRKIEALLPHNHGAPQTIILDTVHDGKEVLRNSLRNLVNEDHLVMLLDEISQRAWPETPEGVYRSKGGLPKVPAKTIYGNSLDGVYFFPRVSVVRLEENRFVLVMLLTRPWKRTPIQQKGFLADIAATFDAGLRIRKARREMLRKGARAAVAAIMGRNMSHNIGSHVLSYWVKRDGDDGASRRLLAYLRNRMDFIAEIATTQPSWSTTMLFCRDVLIPFFTQTALLDFLGRSEDVHFTSCKKLGCPQDSNHSLLAFEVFRQQRTSLKQIFGWKFMSDSYDLVHSPAWYNPEKNTYEFCDWLELSEVASSVLLNEDIAVTIPHSLTGLHALYCIFENFIRNSVKHGGRNSEDFIVRIILDDSDPDLVMVELEDSRQSCTPQVHSTLCDGFAQALADGQGELVHGNWGLKEMKIAACYLRQGRTDLLDEESGFQPAWLDSARDKPYIRPRCEDCGDTAHLRGNCRVGFTFYLLKPKDVALIVPPGEIPSVDKVVSAGISVIGQDELIERYIIHHMPHRLLAYYSGMTDIQDEVESNRSLLPLRILPLVKVDIPFTIPGIFRDWVCLLLNKWKESGKLKEPATKISLVYRHSGAEQQRLWQEKIGNWSFQYIESVDLPSFSKEEKVLLFDDHHKFRDSKQLPSGETLLYYQEVSGAKPTKQIIGEIGRLKKGSPSLRYYELIESSMTRVVIADERIWESVNSKPDVGRNLNAMHIYAIPIEKRRLDLEMFANKVKEYTPDFCIVHQGLLDKLETNNRIRVSEIIASQGAVFVITSGRGTPHSLSTGARFLEISTLETLLDDENKFTLTQVLYSLRRNRYA